LLLIVFLLVNINANPVYIREFIEFIVIESVEPVVTERVATTRAPAATRNPIPATPLLEAAQNLTDIDIPTVTNTDPDFVDITSLPQRADRTVPGIAQGRALQDTLMQATLPSANLTNTSQGTITSPTGHSSNVGTAGFADEIRNQTGQISQYVLEGEARNRTVITRVLPDFPENIMRNASVTLNFVIVENGSIQNISISRRSEPEFERASIDALRQWIFNRADRSHTGQITFNFILE